MKRLVLALVLLATPVFAQDAPPPAQAAPSGPTIADLATDIQGLQRAVNDLLSRQPAVNAGDQVAKAAKDYRTAQASAMASPVAQACRAAGMAPRVVIDNGKANLTCETSQRHRIFGLF